MSFMTFAGVEVPYVHEVKLVKLVGADRARSANFTLNQIVTGVKNQWDVETRVMTPAEAATLLDWLEDQLYSEATFWWQGLGDVSNAVTAIIRVLQVDHEGYGDRSTGAWVTLGNILTFTVEEV